MNAQAKDLVKLMELGDPELDQRVENGIEQNRKGWGRVRLVDAKGEPVSRAGVRLRQTRHAFDFGCNAFLLNQFPEAEKNQAYEEVFRDLFNLAVVPFYWSDLEPEPGKPRFRADSPPIYRRPPPDMVLDFCERAGIKPKGHPLLWHHFRPDWLPQEDAPLRAEIRSHFAAISERYHDRIPVWDVCNEAQSVPFRTPANRMPPNHVEYAFDLAAEYFPDCVKTYNDDNHWYTNRGPYSEVYLLVKSLLDRGYPVDALGLQYHMFKYDRAAEYLSRRNVLDCLDLYGRLNLPINISEISIVSRRDLGDGDAFQDLVTEQMYRLWFSHPSVNGIVWWNLVDNTAAYAPMGDETVGENRLRAGLVNYDLSPKPAYRTLHRLIHGEWTTRTTLEYEAGGPNAFRGFYGDYEVEVRTDAGVSTHPLRLEPGALNTFTLKV